MPKDITPPAGVGLSDHDADSVVRLGEKYGFQGPYSTQDNGYGVNNGYNDYGNQRSAPFPALCHSEYSGIGRQVPVCDAVDPETWKRFKQYPREPFSAICQYVPDEYGSEVKSCTPELPGRRGWER